MSYRDKLKKCCQNHSALELNKAPFSAFEGLTREDVEKMEEVFGVGTIKDLATLKAFEQAHEILMHAKVDVDEDQIVLEEKEEDEL